MSFLGYKLLSREFEIKNKINYPFDSQDIRKIDFKNYFVLTFAGFAAGFISGTVGVGAGLVLVPSMLILKMNPRVSSATSGTMYLFISATSILKTILEGVLTWQTILWYIA
jgi:uncharacterized membrane protein YfcA